LNLGIIGYIESCRGRHMGIALLIALPAVKERISPRSRRFHIEPRTCIDWQSKHPTLLASDYRETKHTHFFPASVAQQQQRSDAGQQTIYHFRVSDLRADECKYSTYCHSHSHDKTDRRAHDFAMAGILVPVSCKQMSRHCNKAAVRSALEADDW
jgi:hypothetical protein